ncbi:hypothetical protein WOLCODRAFT_139358 [Wolfiporia cocos MD-104 SS10]|uniref:Uncharacterized protein n=1 Tax=Wolfiporia cocos (strain MD-104) TaxID=742152 RepID=A0A2H3JS50_WOLCO|nr:hypothetical protein WOLCODRAFT_139358 [Wolfiporia cocos MD-104 SS10]
MRLVEQRDLVARCKRMKNGHTLWCRTPTLTRVQDHVSMLNPVSGHNTGIFFSRLSR